ncbi:dihydrofolate reductase [Roseibium sp.]|uniref:dihydrofolate reductase n=1 Tax=Roseibium sp. TaxID=1936156 RepID=UPI003A982141
MTEIVLIAAMAKNRVIGANGDMPWKISSDLKHFKQLTMGKPMIMGRKTFQSLPGMLPGRPHIVVSRDPSVQAGRAEIVTSLEDALARAKQLSEALSVGQVMVIGGGQIYAQALALADRVELTEINAVPEGDTFFPELDSQSWQVTRRVEGERGPLDSADFQFVTYERKDFQS